MGPPTNAGTWRTQSVRSGSIVYTAPHRSSPPSTLRWEHLQRQSTTPRLATFQPTTRGALHRPTPQEVQMRLRS